MVKDKMTRLHRLPHTKGTYRSSSLQSHENRISTTTQALEDKLQEYVRRPADSQYYHLFVDNWTKIYENYKKTKELIEDLKATNVAREDTLAVGQAKVLDLESKVAGKEREASESVAQISHLQSKIQELQSRTQELQSESTSQGERSAAQISELTSKMEKQAEAFSALEAAKSESGRKYMELEASKSALQNEMDRQKDRAVAAEANLQLKIKDLEEFANDFSSTIPNVGGSAAGQSQTPTPQTPTRQQGLFDRSSPLSSSRGEQYSRTMDRARAVIANRAREGAPQTDESGAAIQPV
jgi:chromosome segregation ATPase